MGEAAGFVAGPGLLDSLLGGCPITALWGNNLCFFFQLRHCFINRFTFKATEFGDFPGVKWLICGTHNLQNFFGDIHGNTLFFLAEADQLPGLGS